MKIIFPTLCTAFVFGLFSTGIANAQTPSSYTFKAILIDSLTKEPIEYATISIYENGAETITKFAISDKKGTVEIPGIRRGTHQVRIDLMGYRTRLQTISFTGSESIVDLGRILMREDVNLLSASVVTAVANPIVVKQDTIQYNAAAFKTSDNDMLEELLKKLPGVEVDTDGKITVNGKEITKVMIDGKTFFTDDPTIATKNLPANIVDRVNVVNRRSDQARFTGIDDGNEEFVLDLSIRPGMMNGWFGNLSAGYGTNDRYQANGMVGRFQNSNQMAFIGNLNNTNNRGFFDAMAGSMQGMRGGGAPGGGGGFGGGGVRFGGNTMNFGGSGLATSWNVGTNMNTELLDKRLKIGGNYFYAGTDTKQERKIDRQDFLPDSTFFSQQDGHANTKTESHRMGMEFDYSLNDQNSILFRPNGSLGYGQMSDSTTRSTTGLSGAKIYDSYSGSHSESQSKSTSGELLLRHRFAKPGNTISFNLNYSLSETTMDGVNHSQTDFYGENARTESIHQQYTQVNNAYSIGGRLSYTQPLGNNYFLELAYRYRYNQNKSEKEAFNFNEETKKYDEKDDDYSNLLKNITIEQQAEVNLRSQQEKYSYTVGFSALPSYISSIDETGGIAPFSRHRFNFTPRVDFRYNFSQNSNLRIEYNGRTNQPSLSQLQPVKDNSDPTRIREGNLDLTPEFSNRFSIDFRDTKLGTFRTISVRSDINYTLNKIINKSEYKDGVLYTSPVNEGTSFTGNLFFTYNSPIAGSLFYITSSGGVNTSSSNSYSNGVKNHTNTLGIREMLRFNYRGEKLVAGLSGRASYSMAWYTIEQNGTNNTWNNQISADINWTLPWGLNVMSDVNYIYYIGYPPGYNKPSTVWNASASKLLFKKMGTLSVRVYDILKEAKSITHNVNDNYIEDIESNVLTRYFMFSFTYRFGTFGGGQQRSRGDWQGPGPGPGSGPVMRMGPGQRF